MIKASQNLFASQKTRFILNCYKYATLDIYTFFENTLDNTSMKIIFSPGLSTTNCWMIRIGVALGASLLIGLAIIALAHIVVPQIGLFGDFVYMAHLDFLRWLGKTYI